MRRLATCLGLLGLACTTTPSARVLPIEASEAAHAETKEAEPKEAETDALSSRKRAENEHVRRIGDQPLLVTADPSLELELSHFFDLLWQMQADGARLYDGQILALAWTTVWFRAERGPEGGEYFVVSAPDYTDEAGEKKQDDLTETLRVLAAQRPWLEITGVDAEPVDFDQQVLVVRGALETEQVFLWRVASPGGRLTGWRLAPGDVSSTDMEVDSIAVHEIWRKRPALMQAMVLPVGWMAYFYGDEIVTLVDPGDQVVWSRAGAGEEAKDKP